MECKRGLKIFCIVTALFLIILLILLVVLFLTVFKPKEPKITPLPVTFQSFRVVVFPVIRLNISLALLVSVDNRNYGGFKYLDSTAYVNYRGALVAEGPIEAGMVPARGKHNVSTTVTIHGDKMVPNPYFVGDILAGTLNFTSTTTLHGKVTVLKYLKKKATTYSSCDISVFLPTQNVTSVCKYNIKF